MLLLSQIAPHFLLLQESLAPFQCEVVEHPITTSEEVIEKTQADLRADFVSLIDRLNLEEAYLDPGFKKEIQAREHQIEMLADWSKPALKGHVGRHLYV